MLPSQAGTPDAADGCAQKYRENDGINEDVTQQGYLGRSKAIGEERYGQA